MCVFCKIAAGEIPANKLYEDEKVLAFYDLDPQAPIHFLVIPKEHIASAGEITPENSTLIAHIFEVIAKICVEHGWQSYRIVNNCGDPTINFQSPRFGGDFFLPAAGTFPCNCRRFML